MDFMPHGVRNKHAVRLEASREPRCYSMVTLRVTLYVSVTLSALQASRS